MTVAQALAEGMTVVTRDVRFAAYGVTTMAA
jgi:PIN domain nuclease of toxin-antitoxin system